MDEEEAALLSLLGNEMYELMFGEGDKVMLLNEPKPHPPILCLSKTK